MVDEQIEARLGVSMLVCQSSTFDELSLMLSFLRMQESPKECILADVLKTEMPACAGMTDRDSFFLAVG